MGIHITESDGLRLLRFGTQWCQGAMRIDAPDALVLPYAEPMFAWLLFHDVGALAGKHLLTLGLGAGSLTKFAVHRLGLEATAVEIDADVIAACRRHFALPADSERLHVVHADAADFMARPGDAYDAIQVDAYDAHVQEPVLDSVAFYADCRARLRPGGTVAVNLIGRHIELRESVARLREGLRPQAVWQFPPTEGGNVIAIAHCGEPPPDGLLSARAAWVERHWGLPAREWVGAARRS